MKGESVGPSWYAEYVKRNFVFYDYSPESYAHSDSTRCDLCSHATWISVGDHIQYAGNGYGAG